MNSGVQPFQVNAIEGFSSAYSYLICMMSQARIVTLESVRNLSMAELDFLLDENANSIGALLAHIAAVERWYQAYTFEKKELAGTDLAAIEAALDMGESGRKQIKGHDLPYYLDELKTVRERTIHEFRQRDEAWLFEQRPFTKNAAANNFYMWYHVFEDETNHRGQINFIRKRIPTL